MKKIAIVVVALVAALGVLIGVGVASAVPRISLAKLTSEHVDGDVQIDDGLVVAIESQMPLKFSIATSATSTDVVRVESPRSVPENFKIGTKVHLTGSYDRSKGVFQAYTVSTVCPSRYEASKEGADAAGSYYSPSSGSPPPAAPGASTP